MDADREAGLKADINHAMGLIDGVDTSTFDQDLQKMYMELETSRVRFEKLRATRQTASRRA